MEQELRESIRNKQGVIPASKNILRPPDPHFSPEFKFSK